MPGHWVRIWGRHKADRGREGVSSSRDHQSRQNRARAQNSAVSSSNPRGAGKGTVRPSLCFRPLA